MATWVRVKIGVRLMLNKDHTPQNPSSYRTGTLVPDPPRNMVVS